MIGRIAKASYHFVLFQLLASPRITDAFDYYKSMFKKLQALKRGYFCYLAKTAVFIIVPYHTNYLLLLLGLA